MAATHVNEVGNTIAATHTGHGPHTADATGHHGALAHQFDNLEQQHDATTVGMWVFLVTEIMFFGGMFFAYTLYRASYPEAFGSASRGLNIYLGTFNTVVLIGSSLTMALAVYFSQVGARKLLVAALAATILLGCVFLGVKVVEYSDKFEHGTFPGANFHYSEPGTDHDPQAAEAHGIANEGRNAAGNTAHSKDSADTPHKAVDPSRVQMFYVIYFAMTGVHALHMIIGIGIMAVLLYYAWRGAYSPEYYSPVELSGLYWHFVDIIWIFLFPLLYLIDRNPFIG